jgi:hypothetical protein
LKFFEPKRWADAIQTGLEKDIKPDILLDLCSVKTRLDLYHRISEGKYVVTPPHEAKIPKEDGTFRTVYVNAPADRVLFGIANDLLFELCPELIHPRCLSYLKNNSCGKAVQKAAKCVHEQAARVTDTIGVKIDLSKYFDSVPIWYIDAVFDYIDDKFGRSCITDLIRNYYHDDTVIDIDKNRITKYTSLRQGCAVAAFLADVVLRHIDTEISSFDVEYFRYSDDILIIGPEYEQAFQRLQAMLADMELHLNPKKIEYLNKSHWFKFLGFNIRDDSISLSKHRLKTFQKEIENRTIRSGIYDRDKLIDNVHAYLYKGNGEFSWATSVLEIMNNRKDLQTMNSFVMDCIRASMTRRHDIGGLGCQTDKNTDYCIFRGKGRHVVSNMNYIGMKYLPGYYTLTCMQNAICTSKPAYDALVRTL